MDIYKICRYCDDLTHDSEMDMFHKCPFCGRDLELATPEETERLLKKESEIHNYVMQKNLDKMFNKTYTPKCPVCGSPNIHKISATKRVVSGAAFGLFSKTARSQWECSNCGNKF